MCRKQVDKEVIQELARPMDWVDIVLTPFIVVIWGGQLLIKAPKRIYNLLIVIAKKSASVCKRLNLEFLRTNSMVRYLNLPFKS